MKKSNVLGLAILFFAGLFTVACANDNSGTANNIDPRGVTMGDFSLSVTLDKTEARIGDTITAIVVFKNLSGRDIEAELPDWIAAKGGQGIEDILQSILVPEGVEWFFPSIKFEPRPIILIESGAVIERLFEHTVTESGDLEILGGAFFNTADDTANPYGIQIVRNSIIIKVQ
ncbi:MAG: hypothetical protein FWG89_01230 [Treponema sp.]|nr:hypothetical protein [Treponema sp.]